MGMALPKTLQRELDRSGLFSECYADGDGYWLTLKPGFIGPSGAHTIHEHNIKECLWQIKEVVPCDCDQCEASRST